MACWQSIHRGTFGPSIKNRLLLVMQIWSHWEQRHATAHHKGDIKWWFERKIFINVLKKKNGRHEGPVKHMCVYKMTAAQSVDWWFGLLGPSSTQETACQISLITPSCKELTHTSFSQGNTTFNKCEITSIELQVWNWGYSHSFLPLTSIVRKRKIHTTLKHLLRNDLTTTHPASF